MSITIEDIVELQHDHLRTVGSKLVYLTIRNTADEGGWATISLAQLARTTSQSRRGIVKMLQRMQGLGLVEIQPDHTRHDSKNRYRVLEL